MSAAGLGPRIAVLDYGAGNIVSVEQALLAAGAQVRLVADADALRGADAVVVPGVGAAGPAMERLADRRLIEPILDWIAAGRPYLGICLGMQLLFDASDEDGATTFGVLPGRTASLDEAPTLPHVGWNEVDQVRDHPLFEGIADGAEMYFVHSYAGLPALSAEDAVIARTEHGGPFVSAVARGPLLGVQFHPERSGADGLHLLANFVALVRTGALAPAAVAG